MRAIPALTPRETEQLVIQHDQREIEKLPVSPCWQNSMLGLNHPKTAGETGGLFVTRRCIQRTVHAARRLIVST